MTKQERLDAYLDEHDLEAVWFARPNSFTWLTGGNNVVDREGDIGVAAVGYDGNGLEVVTNNIEGDRLREEELDDDVVVTEFQWYESSLAEAVADHSAEPAAADFDVEGFETVDASPLRQPLTEEDIENYRDLGYDTAEAVEAVCRELQPGDVESEVASALRVALSARGIEVPVALCSHGHHASMTRTVAFGEEGTPSEEVRELGNTHQGARIVEMTALGATQAVAKFDGDAGDVFDAVQAAYEHVGHPDEWELHHQGGAAGFAGREWVGTPDSDAEVTTPMAYAWNPTIQGTKSEDTVLVTEDGLEVLTTTGQWPTTAVDGWDYDVILERADVLVKDVETESN